jgi:hypothetical protein
VMPVSVLVFSMSMLAMLAALAWLAIDSVRRCVEDLLEGFCGEGEETGCGDEEATPVVWGLRRGWPISKARYPAKLGVAGEACWEKSEAALTG